MRKSGIGNLHRADSRALPDDIAIRVENVSKLYRIGRTLGRQDTLRDVIADRLNAPLRRWQRQRVEPASSATPSSTGSGIEDTIWALREVSFQVKRGEVVGVIGPNGSGKSTLLKILSRITEPTEGGVDFRGHVGTLLEVGTGFHPELTGRENIYLSGAIMGMRRAEIDRKFEEIVGFAEVEKFIDTPVKRYSSGMYVRLAFAVAASLEPDILLVDEVLAVGDAAFQKKCLGKMGDVAKGGRTVLFISHNMGQIRNLCQKGLWLNRGRVKHIGTSASAIAAYQASLAQIAGQGLRDGNPEAKQNGFVSWQIVGTTEPDEAHSLLTHAPFAMEIVLRLDRSLSHAHHGLVLESPEGVKIAGWGVFGLALQPGTYKFSYHFSQLPLRPGVYYWYASLWDGARKIDVAHLLPELVVATEDYSTLSPEWAGMLNVPCEIDVNLV